MSDEIKFENINSNEDLNYLISRITHGPVFAEAFKFKSEELKEKFFNALNMSITEFEKKYYYFDKEKKLHISESEREYIWISTMGLISQRGTANDSNNSYLNSCRAQYIVLCLLFEKAISLCEDEETYDVDGFNYEYLSELTPVLFHNILFYFEIFGKTYLSINNVQFEKKHKLSNLLQKVKEAMFNLSHNDTSFHAYIISAFEIIVEYINKIPGNFKEEFVKYDDNAGDSTIIMFDRDEFIRFKYSIDIGEDFINELYFYKDSKDIMHLKPGLYNRLLEMAQNDEEKQRIKDTYSFLIASKEKS